MTPAHPKCKQDASAKKSAAHALATPPDIRPPARTIAASALVLAISGAMMSAQAQEVTLETMDVDDSSLQEQLDANQNPYSEPGAPYKAKKLSDSRRTRDLADTPQTATVLTKDVILDSGKTELKDILSAQPGITLGTGEGGNSFGDRYIIRGYEARSDVYTDGLREPGLITRETFAIEQVEISKGPSSTFGGRGTTGGAINSVTKKATTEDSFTDITAGLGSDDYQRVTVDTNIPVTDRFAVRINGLLTEADIPDRAPAGEDRYGGLISAVYEATDALKISADYYHFRGEDRTDPGVALARLDDGSRPVDSLVPYYGPDGLDFQDTAADIATLTLDWSINDALRLENKTRVGNTTNDYIISLYSSRGGGGLRSFSRWQDNDYFGNQTNLIAELDFGGMTHSIVTGVELAREKVVAGAYDISTTSFGDLAEYQPDYDGWEGTVAKSPGTSNLTLDTVSYYLMDTVAVTDALEIFAGVRYDDFDYKLWTAASNGRGGPRPAAQRDYGDGFWNGHVGVVWAPWANGNLYASASSSSNINGGEADAGSNCGYGGLCTDAEGVFAADPEQSINYEIGTKWNLMDQKLLLTAALFQTTKDDVIEGSTNSYQPEGNLNTGKNRVEGLEISASGNITDKLSIAAGAAFMESETLESWNPDNIGKPKANFADNSANLQMKYQLSSQISFGGTATYSSEIYGGQPDEGANTSIVLPDYTVYDVFARFDFTPQLGLLFNIQNLTDEDYHTAVYRGGSIVYLGDARSAKATLSYKF